MMRIATTAVTLFFVFGSGCTFFHPVVIEEVPGEPIGVASCISRHLTIELMEVTHEGLWNLTLSITNTAEQPVKIKQPRINYLENAEARNIIIFNEVGFDMGVGEERSFDVREKHPRPDPDQSLNWTTLRVHYWVGSSGRPLYDLVCPLDGDGLPEALWDRHGELWDRHGD